MRLQFVRLIEDAETLFVVHAKICDVIDESTMPVATILSRRLKASYGTERSDFGEQIK